MSSMLTGRLPLQDLISQVINDARVKVASAEGKDDDKKEKLLAYEKKEHGHLPSIKEEKEEKKEKSASAIDFDSPEDLEKLASALDVLGSELEKGAADQVNIGGESHQGGQVLAVMAPVKGEQSNKKDKSKSHNIPLTSGTEKDPSQGPVSNMVPTNAAKAPGGGGTQKVSAAESVIAKINGALSKMAEFPPEMMKKKEEKKPEEKKESKSEEKDEKKEEGSEKKSSALEYVLGKMAESSQGGETLDSKSGEGPKPPSDSKGGNEARKAIDSNQAAINMKKVDGKKVMKRQLSVVLSEPAMSAAHDHKVQENLQNASKGGVKIAEAKSQLQKIAKEGCTCSGKGECKYCKMKTAMSAKKEESSSSAAGE